MSQSSQMDHSVLQMDNQDIERMVAEVVQYFLIMEQKKFPVRKQDITKLLNLKGNSMKTFKSVLTASDKYLEDVRLYLRFFPTNGNFDVTLIRRFSDTR